MVEIPRKCGYEWYARHAEPPPKTRVTSRKQVCIKLKDHEDDHMSQAKVTVANQKKEAK